MENKIKGIGEILKKYPVILGYLYGSQVSGNVTKFSDIDIAILIDEELYNKNQKDSKKILEINLDILGDLLKFFQINDVDLQILNETSIIFKYNILKKGKLIYCSDPSIFHRFKEKVCADFFDFSPIFNFYRTTLYKKLGISYD